MSLRRRRLPSVDDRDDIDFVNERLNVSGHPRVFALHFPPGLTRYQTADER